jgi:hypothetical protein
MYSGGVQGWCGNGVLRVEGRELASDGDVKVERAGDGPT